MPLFLGFLQILSGFQVFGKSQLLYKIVKKTGIGLLRMLMLLLELISHP